MVADERRPIVLHSSWRGRMTGLIGPLLLVALGGYGVIVGGFRVLPTVLLGIGLVLVVIVTMDFPLRTVFRPEGIDRHCLLRTEHLKWGKVRSIARPASTGLASRFSSNSSGLIAEVGKRPHLLVDRLESQAEHEALERAVAEWHPGLVFRASKPPDGAAPTWLYKRRHGNSDEGLVDEL